MSNDYIYDMTFPNKGNTSSGNNAAGIIANSNGQPALHVSNTTATSLKKENESDPPSVTQTSNPVESVLTEKIVIHPDTLVSATQVEINSGSSLHINGK